MQRRYPAAVRPGDARHAHARRATPRSDYKTDRHLSFLSSGPASDQFPKAAKWPDHFFWRNGLDGFEMPRRRVTPADPIKYPGDFRLI